MNTGIYRIVNILNGKYYIGSTSRGFRQRWWCHKGDLNKGIHRNSHLQSAWNKYGKENFLFEILMRCPPEQCISLEQRYLDTMDWSQSYNIAKVAGSGLGVKLSPEVRRRMSEARIGKKTGPRSPEACLNISLGHIGLKRSPEVCLAMSLKLKGRIGGHTGHLHTEDAKRRISEAHKGQPSKLKGRPRSEETKKKISDAMKARFNQPII
jgi:group I intron endonuclease